MEQHFVKKILLLFQWPCRWYFFLNFIAKCWSNISLNYWIIIILMWFHLHLARTKFIISFFNYNNAIWNLHIFFNFFNIYINLKYISYFTIINILHAKNSEPFSRPKLLNWRLDKSLFCSNNCLKINQNTANIFPISTIFHYYI